MCCLKEKPDEIESETCSKEDGYQCLPIQECNTDDEFSKKDSDNDLFTIRTESGLLDFNNEISLCPDNDYHVCCKPLVKPIETTTKIPTPKTTFQAECGRHNQGGLAMNAISPRDQNFASQFGEWPHVCLLLKLNNNQRHEFLGGASLIAPGVAITAAHKVE